MKVDVSFSFAKVYNVDRLIDVVQGQEFTLITDTPSNWYSDNDQALDVDGNTGKVKAVGLGTSSILMTTGTPGKDFVVWKEIAVNVLPSIEDPATSLGATAGTPVPK